MALDLDAGWEKEVPKVLISLTEDLVQRNHNLAAEMMLLAMKESKDSVTRMGGTPNYHWFRIVLEVPREYADKCACIIGGGRGVRSMRGG